MRSAGAQFSDHPVDRLIRELIRSRREASPDEIRQIVDRVATAAFDPREVAVPLELQGRRYGGYRLGQRARSVLVHLAQRVLLDLQWAPGTTETEYLADLTGAVRDPAARIVVYERRGGSIAGAVAPNRLPAARRGADASPLVYVVYAADRGTIVSGYQASRLDALTIPADAQWLT